jgi:hypothetical protein
MHAMQASVGQPPGETTMMWNPPWVPVLLSPILGLPFEVAAFTWFVCNLALLWIIALFTPRALGYRGLSPWVYAAGMCFVPFIDCLKWGQLSLIHTVGFVLFLYFTRLQRFCLAGVVTALLLGKPHLFLLFIIPGLLWFVALAKYHRRAFIAGAVTAVTALIAATLVYCPDALIWWLEALHHPTTEHGVITIREWQTATLASLVRTVIGASTGRIPDWPLWAFPLIGLAITSAYFMKRSSRIVWSDTAPALLCISCLCAGYGWFYDQSVLIVTQFSLLCRALGEGNLTARYVTFAGLATMQLAIIAINLLTVSAQLYYVWLPLALLGLLWGYSRRAY